MKNVTKNFCKHCGREIDFFAVFNGQDRWAERERRTKPFYCGAKAPDDYTGKGWHQPLEKQDHFKSLYNKLL